MAMKLRRLLTAAIVIGSASAIVVLDACCSRSLSSVPPPGSDPRARIRAMAHLNSYPNLHCWCCAADDSAIDAIYRELTPAQCPLLIELLGDPDQVVSGAADGVLVRFGSNAMPYLKAAEHSSSPEISRRVTDVIISIHVDQAHPRRWN